jgi:uncharacterized damage-inducible protein DinB
VFEADDTWRCQHPSQAKRILHPANGFGNRGFGDGLSLNLYSSDMTIGLDRLLRHMGWANQKTITHLESLSEESLSAFATNSEWFVAEILHHIVDSADHYAFRISGKPALSSPGEPCIDDVKQISDLARIKEQAAIVDAALLECVKLDDVQIEFENYSGKMVKRWRSTILSQAIHHATEHRAQIASALEARGFVPVDLDELDLWSYEIETGQ